jgi:hypothetical protein
MWFELVIIFQSRRFQLWVVPFWLIMLIKDESRRSLETLTLWAPLIPFQPTPVVWTYQVINFFSVLILHPWKKACKDWKRVNWPFKQLLHYCLVGINLTEAKQLIRVIRSTKIILLYYRCGHTIKKKSCEDWLQACQVSMLGSVTIKGVDKFFQTLARLVK